MVTVYHTTSKDDPLELGFQLVANRRGGGDNHRVVVPSPPSPTKGLAVEWKLLEKNLKRYPHFDSDISANDAEHLAKSPSSVAKHAFYPFILYSMRWNKWAEKGKKGKLKERLIRYAARRDAYIYSYYRHLISEKFEVILAQQGLNNSVIAYRKVADPSGGGKCNIHFARDAFEGVKAMGDCAVACLDISSFFESIDHARLKAVWCSVLGVKSLPEDHFSVYKNITSYSYVDKLEAYERLGLFGLKTDPKTGRQVRGYLVSYDDVPKPQLCKPHEFRQKIAGGDGRASIIHRNDGKEGIPQGAPISDVLANMYLLDFDIAMKAYVEQRGGFYYRYSDDILIAINGGAKEGELARAFAVSEIEKSGDKMKIKKEKSSIHVFSRQTSGVLKCHRHFGHEGQGKNGLEYLGFRFDGQRVYIKDATISNLWRKVTRSAKRHGHSLVTRYSDKTPSQILNRVNIEKFIEKFGRVEDFGDEKTSVKDWTFWTYARRSSEVMGYMGRPISRQLSSFRRVLTEKLVEGVEAAHVRVHKP